MGRTEEGRRGREEDDGWDHCISVLGMKKLENANGEDVVLPHAIINLSIFTNG
jgi:hypothetical protein